MDGDGDVDLVSVSAEWNFVSVFLNQGNGTFAPQVLYPVGVTPTSMAIADLDGDGDADLVTGHYPFGTVGVLLNHGDGTFAPMALYPANTRTGSVSASDFDGDGDLDLATTGEFGTVSILFNQGAGTFAAPVDYSVDGSPHFAISSDWDLDGDMDLAVSCTAIGIRCIALLLNQSDGTFDGPVLHGVGLVPVSPTHADFNGDGFDDIACSNYGSTTVSVLLNAGPCASVGSPYCFGDGTGTACPCGNSGALGHGCANSVNAAGALLEARGTPSVAHDSAELHASGMPNGPCLYFQGTAQTSVVFADGLRCVSGSIVRLAVNVNTAGASQYPGPGDALISLRGLIPATGATRNYQVWYRNVASFCTPFAHNLSNGIQIAWTP